MSYLDQRIAELHWGNYKEVFEYIARNYKAAEKAGLVDQYGLAIDTSHDYICSLTLDIDMGEKGKSHASYFLSHMKNMHEQLRFPKLESINAKFAAQDSAWESQIKNMESHYQTIRCGILIATNPISLKEAIWRTDGILTNHSLWIGNVQDQLMMSNIITNIKTDPSQNSQYSHTHSITHYLDHQKVHSNIDKTRQSRNHITMGDWMKEFKEKFATLWTKYLVPGTKKPVEITSITIVLNNTSDAMFQDFDRMMQSQDPPYSLPEGVTVEKGTTIETPQAMLHSAPVNYPHQSIPPNTYNINYGYGNGPFAYPGSQQSSYPQNPPPVSSQPWFNQYNQNPYPPSNSNNYYNAPAPQSAHGARYPYPQNTNQQQNAWQYGQQQSYGNQSCGQNQ